jgi:hypothetical protein
MRGGGQPVDKEAIIFCFSGGYVTQDEMGPGYERVYKKIGEISGIGFYECNILCDACPSKLYILGWKYDTRNPFMKYAEDRTNIGYEIKDAIEKNDSKIAEKLLFEFTSLRVNLKDK